MSATLPLSTTHRAGFAGPHGSRLLSDPGEAYVEEAAALVESEYWNEGVPRERLVRAMLGSTALGFVETRTEKRAWPSAEMVLRRR